MKESITKAERLKKRSDIVALFRTKKSVGVPALRVRYRSTTYGYCRVLVAPLRGEGTKIGGVQRNAVRRVGRELYRRNKGLLRGLSCDMALMVSTRALDISFDARTASYRALIAKMRRVYG